MDQVVIIGGGIAGLICAYQLRRSSFRGDVILIEKNEYPHHKVCGEYVSNEVKPFLKRNDLYPEELNPASIDQFILTSVNGKKALSSLKMGGFGISRYTFDNYLYQKAKDAGVTFYLKTQVKEFIRHEEGFELILNTGKTLYPDYLIGAHGKRSSVDKILDRKFMHKRSGYIGVKYHIKTDFDPNTIALHNFNGGYCGISRVENDTFNLCYLGKRDHLRQFGNIREMEENILYKNPFLKHIFENSDFLFADPVVINEFSFKKKTTHEDGILMIGDAAGLITPLCGNGMALAIHSAKIFCDIFLEEYETGKMNYTNLISRYDKAWKRNFAFRLQTGRTVQNLFGSNFASNFAVGLMNSSQMISQAIIRNTHGKYF